MSFGALLRKLRDENKAEEALFAVGDLVLVAEVELIRQSFGESTSEYVAAAAQRFANTASDDDWLQLMNRLERAGDHAAVCLGTMLRWAIRTDNAQAHGTHGECGCAHHGEGHDGRTA